jgi:hypothetical protein
MPIVPEDAGTIRRPRRSSPWRRVHLVHVHHFEPEPGDSMQKSQERRLIGQLGAHGSLAATHGDLAVIEFRSRHRTGLACESNLIRLGLHKDHASKSPDLSCRQHAGWLEPRHHLREGEPGPRASSPETLIPSSQAPRRAHGGQLTAAASPGHGAGLTLHSSPPIPPPGGLALPINVSNGSKISTRTAHRLHRTCTHPAPTELAR